MARMRSEIVNDIAARRKKTPTATTTSATSTAVKKGIMAGYTGPKVGTPEWKAARKAGQHPIMDYIKSEMAKRKAARQSNRPGYNTGIVPPAMGGSPVPRPTSKPTQGSGYRPAATAAKKSPAAAMSLMSRKPMLITKKK